MGLFESIEANDNELKLSARQAVVLAKRRCESQFGTFLRTANTTTDFTNRLSLVEERLDYAVRSACDEVGHADYDSIRQVVVANLTPDKQLQRTASFKEARKPKMCPYHNEVMDISLAAGDPQAGYNSMSSHAWGPKHCQGGEFAGNCNFKKEMVTQSYWDNKAEEAEQRAEQRREQQEALIQEQAPIAEIPVDQTEIAPVEDADPGLSFDEISAIGEGITDIAPAEPAMAMAARVAGDNPFAEEEEEKKPEGEEKPAEEEVEGVEPAVPGEEGEEGLEQPQGEFSPEAMARFQELLPKLIQFCLSGDSALDDPEVKELHDMLEAEKPGYLHGDGGDEGMFGGDEEGGDVPDFGGGDSGSSDSDSSDSDSGSSDSGESKSESKPKKKEEKKDDSGDSEGNPFAKKDNSDDDDSKESHVGFVDVTPDLPNVNVDPAAAGQAALNAVPGGAAVNGIQQAAPAIAQGVNTLGDIGSGLAQIGQMAQGGDYSGIMNRAITPGGAIGGMPPATTGPAAGGPGAAVGQDPAFEGAGGAHGHPGDSQDLRGMPAEQRQVSRPADQLAGQFRNAPQLASTREAEALKTIDLSTGGGGSSGPDFSRSRHAEGVPETETSGSPNPTKTVDITKGGDPKDEADVFAQTDAVSEKVDVEKKNEIKPIKDNNTWSGGERSAVSGFISDEDVQQLTKSN